MCLYVCLLVCPVLLSVFEVLGRQRSRNTTSQCWWFVVYMFLFVFWCVCLSVCLPGCPFLASMSEVLGNKWVETTTLVLMVCSSMHVYVGLLACLSVCLAICLSVRLSCFAINVWVSKKEKVPVLSFHLCLRFLKKRSRNKISVLHWFEVCLCLCFRVSFCCSCCLSFCLSVCLSFLFCHHCTSFLGDGIEIQHLNPAGL